MSELEEETECTFVYERNGVLYHTPSEDIANMRCNEKGYKVIFNS